MTADLHLLDAALRTDFMAFLHRCMLTLNPGEPFQLNWHHEAIGHWLLKVLTGEETRVIINAPPRSLKSIEVSVAFVAYMLGLYPRRRIFAISYGAELAAKHASDFLSIVQSEWYQRAFPKMRISRVVDNAVYTTSGGFRKTTSVYGPLTGLGGDCFIVDDPQKAVDAQSDAMRDRTNDWFSSTLVSRLDNKLTGVIIVVQQRVHANDLTGHLLDRSAGRTLLSRPAIAETDQEIPIMHGRVHKRRIGDALHPEREPLTVLEQQRAELGPDLFTAQYQQSPVPPGGAMIRREWLRYWDTLPPIQIPRIMQSWDTAGKDGPQNSWSVGTTWILLGDDFYLIDLVRGRYLFHELQATALALARKYRPQWVHIEDASTGTALADMLKRSYFDGLVKLVPVERDKIAGSLCIRRNSRTGTCCFPATLLTFRSSRPNC
jgi:hypothetical protein